MMHLKNNKQI